MSQEPVSNRIVTLPNLISFVRLLAVPVFWWLLLGRDDVTAATILLFIISWSDWVDGYLARRLDQVSELGKNLDPVADRLMIASAVIAGLIAGIVPMVVGIPLMVREVYMAAVALTLATRRLPPLTVRWLGKAATFLVYGSVEAFYLVAVPFLDALFRPVAWVTGVGGLVLYWLVAVQYTSDARRAISQLESTSVPEEI